MFLMVDEEEEGVSESSGSFNSNDFGEGINNISILLLFLLFIVEEGDDEVEVGLLR
jgi:hypothetical protein